jgi:hypothetical protein
MLGEVIMKKRIISMFVVAAFFLIGESGAMEYMKHNEWGMSFSSRSSVNNMPTASILIRDSNGNFRFYQTGEKFDVTLLEGIREVPLVSTELSTKIKEIVAITQNMKEDTALPEDGETIYLLKSLCALKNIDTDVIDEKLYQFSNFYYKTEDPYFKALSDLQKISPYNSKGLFNEQSLKNMEVVLNFSKVAASNPDCKKDFEIWKKALSDLIESTASNVEEKGLLERFNALLLEFQ